MKTKTIFKTLAFAMLMPAMLLTTACSSDDDAVNNNENTQKKYYEIPVTVTVTRQGEGTRATYDGETQKLSFSTGDKLFVNGHHNTAGTFAGALDLVSASDGTFEGTVIAEEPYTAGTAEAFLKETGTYASATLLPAGYENYNYLKFYQNDNPVNAITFPNTYVSAIFNNSLLPLGKAEAVAQLSYEFAPNYDGYVFALSPQRPVICCTITGLPVETSVPVVYDGKYNDFSGYITTDASGTATFAFTDFAEDPLGSLTVNGNAIDLPSNKTLAAGKIYSINRSIAPAPAAKAAAEATTEDKGKLIGTDGNIYANVAAATAAGTTAVAKIIYLGTTGHSTYTHGLALALTDEASTMAWQAAIDACSAKNTSTPVTGATWLLASQAQWNYMLGTDGAGSHYDLRDGFSSVGGSNMQWNYYWSSTEDDSDYAWYYSFAYGTWLRYKKGGNNYVRACLAF